MKHIKFPKYQHYLKLQLPVSLLLSLLTITLSAQKIEMEERIPASDFPEPALERVMEKFPDGRRMKLYREISKADSVTYEAKLKSDGHWYSIEFYPDSRLVDIEKQVKFRSLPQDLQETIRSRWEKDFKRSRVIKCQEQTSDLGIRYEIEVRGKGEQRTAFYQYLFAADGTYIERETIVLRSSDMTLY